MTLGVAEPYEPLLPGLYVGELLDVESRESTNGQYRRWCWEILEGPYAGQKVYANTSINFGPQAKARLWVENILGRELEAGEQISTDDLDECCVVCKVKRGPSEFPVQRSFKWPNP